MFPTCSSVMFHGIPFLSIEICNPPWDSLAVRNPVRTLTPFQHCEVLLLALNSTVMHYPASRALKQTRRRTVITGNAARGAVRFAKLAIRALVHSHALLHRCSNDVVIDVDGKPKCEEVERSCCVSLNPCQQAVSDYELMIPVQKVMHSLSVILVLLANELIPCVYASWVSSVRGSRIPALSDRRAASTNECSLPVRAL
jgi:hypothetical protein